MKVSNAIRYTLGLPGLVGITLLISHGYVCCWLFGHFLAALLKDESFGWDADDYDDVLWEKVIVGIWSPVKEDAC